MNIFQRIRLYIKALFSGGNPTWIAQNVACIYYCIDQHPFCTHLIDDEKLYAAALIDSASYLSRQALGTNDIKDAVRYGSLGFVSLFPYQVQHRKLFDFEENASLIGLVMQLEADFFRLDSKKSSKAIVDFVIAKKHTISNAVNKTLSEGKQCSLYAGVSQTVNMYVSSEEFMEYVESFDEK